MNTNKMETVIKAIWNLKVKLQETKTKNEANTIQNFIIKILSEFGWDVFDDAEVDMQYTQNISGAADIAQFMETIKLTRNKVIENFM